MIHSGLILNTVFTTMMKNYKECLHPVVVTVLRCYCEVTAGCVHYNMQMLCLVQWVFKLIEQCVLNVQKHLKDWEDFKVVNNTHFKSLWKYQNKINTFQYFSFLIYVV